MVIDVSNKNSVVGGSVGSAVKQVGGTTYQVVTGGEEGTTLISFVPVVNNWIFTLPITPQQLSITDQFAIDRLPPPFAVSWKSTMGSNSR